MSRTPSTFRETDLKRALRAIEGAGKKAASLEIKDGCITIKLKDGKCAADKNDDNADNTNPWDKVDLK